MVVKFKKLKENAQPPAYGSAMAAGADLYACLQEALTLPAGGTALIPTGIAIELPQGTVGLVYARSGLATKRGLAPANKVGVIDCDYRGEILVSLYNHSAEPQTVLPGERVAQLVITPYFSAEFEQTNNLSQTARDQGGFGSTGRV